MPPYIQAINQHLYMNIHVQPCKFISLTDVFCIVFNNNRL